MAATGSRASEAGWKKSVVALRTSTAATGTARTVLDIAPAKSAPKTQPGSAANHSGARSPTGTCGRRRSVRSWGTLTAMPTSAAAITAAAGSTTASRTGTSSDPDPKPSAEWTAAAATATPTIMSHGRNSSGIQRSTGAGHGRLLPAVSGIAAGPPVLLASSHRLHSAAVQADSGEEEATTRGATIHGDTVPKAALRQTKGPGIRALVRRSRPFAADRRRSVDACSPMLGPDRPQSVTCELQVTLTVGQLHRRETALSTGSVRRSAQIES